MHIIEHEIRRTKVRRCKITKSNIRNSEINFLGKYDYLGCGKRSIHKWDKVFEIGPNKICGRQPLKKFKGYGLLKHTISLQIFKDCLPKILLGPFLNTLFQTAKLVSPYLN